MQNLSIQDQLESFIPTTISNLHREYPNGIHHRVFGDEDNHCQPSKLYPAFYGCYDWHSAVHSHWQVARAIRLFPEADFAADGFAALNRSLTNEHIATEVAYLSNRSTFEMPYGMAWLLQLTAELREWFHEDAHQDRRADAKKWLTALGPLEEHAVTQFTVYLNKMERPVRTGTHNQSAFSLGLAYDWAVVAGDNTLQDQIRSRVRHYYGADQNAPFAYEPSGTDFLSPTLAEADLMRRVLAQDKLVNWLDGFFGQGEEQQLMEHIQPVEVGDFSDGQLAHFAGLNMSRAWMLGKLAAALPSDSPRAKSITRLAHKHRDMGLGSALHQDYMVSHWAPTFVVYLLTER